jgi:hypothetical protein
MSFDMDDYETLSLLYGEDADLLWLRRHGPHNRPFNLTIADGRARALEFLKVSLPDNVWVIVAMYCIGEHYAVHPKSGILVEVPQLKLSRLIFCHIFTRGDPNDVGHFMFGKCYGENLSRCFCSNCGEATKKHTHNDLLANCKNCKHGSGNITCRRLNVFMAGVCHKCIYFGPNLGF